MALSYAEPSLRVESLPGPGQNHYPEDSRDRQARSTGTESFTFDQANGAPSYDSLVTPIRAGRIDDTGAMNSLPQGAPELDRLSGQDVSPASSMTGSFTAEKEELSSRQQRKNAELRNLFKLPAEEVCC